MNLSDEAKQAFFWPLAIGHLLWLLVLSVVLVLTSKPRASISDGELSGLLVRDVAQQPVEYRLAAFHWMAGKADAGARPYISDHWDVVWEVMLKRNPDITLGEAASEWMAMGSP